MRDTLFGLLDCNNFYVSCERVFRPDLENKPVVVLSNNDGCIISRSNEIKALGVPMGVPLFKVKDFLRSHNTFIFSSNYALYGDLSRRVFSLLEEMVPRMEIYSIDEAFIDFSGIPNPHELATHIRKQILKQTGIPTCIGISFTKTLAKVANERAKKNPALKGVCYLSQENEIDQLLHNMDLADIWGIGRKSAEKLKNSGIQTALQFKKSDPKWIRKKLTVTGERTLLELNSFPCMELEEVPSPRQSIQVTRTFSKEIVTVEELRQKIVEFTERAGEKMRSQNLSAQAISVFVRTNRHKKEAPQYNNWGIYSLSYPTNDNFTLLNAATNVLHSLFREGYSYRKGGIMVHDLISCDSTPVQLNLLGDPTQQTPKTISLMKAIDSINKRYGRNTVKSAGGKVKNRNKISEEALEKNSPIPLYYKSPAYSTRWSDLLTIQI